MNTSATSQVSTAVPLDPFPDGWYVIGESDDIRVGKLIEKIWMGEQIVVWRGPDGTVCVADAFCPHLGSHLGPTTGGRIRNGNLVCPFHGFEYDVTGQCVATPTAPPPRSARLRRFETAEVNGFVFAYHGRTPDEPTWQVPDFSGGPSFRAAKRLRFPGHPQTTSENSVDLAHLGHIHGYRELEQTTPTTVDGPVWLVMDLKRLPQWRWLSGPLAWIANRLVLRLLVRESELEVLKDAEIWARQSYRPSPAFSEADRDILQFRRYCEQFYAQPPSG